MILSKYFNSGRACLQSRKGFDAFFFSHGSKCFRLRRFVSKQPFAKDHFTCFERCSYEMIMCRNFNRNKKKLYFRMVDQVIFIIKSV
jgi:hypothetical protein